MIGTFISSCSHFSLSQVHTKLSDYFACATMYMTSRATFYAKKEGRLPYFNYNRQ